MNELEQLAVEQARGVYALLDMKSITATDEEIKKIVDESYEGGWAEWVEQTFRELVA